jgi:2-hydroxy-3-keto-5-methylthiopentenyl-1-phosphate phosphatase
MRGGRLVFLTDFDGTVTRNDFFHLALDAIGFAPEDDPWAAFHRGELTHFDALARIFAAIRLDAAGFDAMIDQTEPDPLFSEDLHRLADAGWELHVVSAGCGVYIDRFLERAGLGGAVSVHANPGRFVPGRGLFLERPKDARIRDAAVGIDKAAVLRLHADGAARVAFAGDSRPDLEAARLVDERDRFAKRNLATELDRLGLGFRPFARWHDVARALLDEDDGSP